MRRSDSQKRGTWVGFFRVVAVFFGAGLVLFFYVWWPIQAERHLVALKRVETELLEKKSELNALSERYGRLTSLTTLDTWAKEHGPWKNPGPGDIVAIN